MVSFILEYGHNGTFSPYGLGVFGNYITQKVRSLLPCNLYEITLILCLWDTIMYDNAVSCHQYFLQLLSVVINYLPLGGKGETPLVFIFALRQYQEQKLNMANADDFGWRWTVHFFFWIDKEDVLMIKEGMYDVCRATKRPKKVAGDTKTSICALYGA